MTPSEKLVTLARRNCIDNILYWTNYYETTKGKNSSYDYNIFPRYQTAEAILKDIETLVGKDFLTLNDCCKEIRFFGLNSQSHFTTGKLNDLQNRAINDARKKFLNFIDNLSNDQIEKVEPLPFRRRFLEDEANKVRKELEKHWNFNGGYWEPLTPCSPKPFAFFDKENLNENDFQKIKDIILNQSNDRIYEISEERYDYEIDKSEIDPDYYEIIYTDKNFEWIIYGSHEETIAFGGEWLLSELDKQLSDKIEFKNEW